MHVLPKHHQRTADLASRRRGTAARATALAVAAAAGITVLSGCAGAAQAPAAGGSATYGVADAWPENLFPYIAAGNTTTVQDLLGRVLPSVYIVQPDYTVEYDRELLADEPQNTLVDELQTTVYRLNPDAVWSDGTPITADDFAYTWHVSTSTDQGGCAGNMSTTGVENISSVTGSDNGRTVTVTYATPFSDWQSLFSGAQPLLPAHLMADDDPVKQCATFDAGWATADGLPEDISGGPWQLKRGSIDASGQTAVLTPNPEYWGAAPGLSRLIVRVVGADPDVQALGLENGELDVIRPQPQLDLIERIDAQAPDVTSESTFGLSFEHLDFNTQDPQLADVNVRRAFAMALDRQEIVDQTVGQIAPDAKVLDNHLYVNNQPEYRDNAPAEYRTQDIAGAKALLEQSGYELGDDGVYAKGDQRLSFRIDTTPGNALRETTITVMAQQLAQAGIEVTFNPNPDLFSGPDVPTSVVAGGFQIALFASTGSPFATSLLPSYQSPARGFGQNVSRAGTAEIDALLDEVAADQDRTEQAADANAVDALLWEQMATVPLYQKPTLLAYDSALRDVRNNASQSGPLWNAEAWTLEQ
ncbi:ABC transporter family substrate-binding protein [Geodermatophilus sp. URMC 64]